MLRERSTLITNLHRFLDISLTVAAFVSAYFIKLYLLPKSMRGLTTEPNYYEVLFLIIMVWYLCFAYFKLYESYRKRTLATVLLQVIKAVSAGMVLMVLILYVLKIFNVSRLLLFLFYIINIALLAFAESSIFFFLRKYRRNGFNYRNILIVGSKEKAKNLILKINAHAETGYRVAALLWQFCDHTLFDDPKHRCPVDKKCH